MKFRGVISLRKLLPIWAMPKGIRTRVLSQHVLEVDEDALGRFGAEEGRVFLAAQRADDGLEHQVEFARLGQRAQRLGVGAQHLREIGDRGQRDQRALPGQFVGVLGRAG